ncbi:MAG TPA: AraC family transcriptional regulator [Terrimicrobiaceae bacterium]
MLLYDGLHPLRATSQIPRLNITEGHSHEHDELCLISAGMPLVRHAGREIRGEAGTLFLFTRGEAHGVWDVGTTVARLWSLEFRINSQVRAEFHDLFERSPERRMLKLSADQQQRFCNTCKKIAFEKIALQKGGSFAPAHATTAASVLLALQLIDVARWFSMHSEINLVEGREKVDRPCFELRQQIYRHASLSTPHGPMLFNLNPRHDSVRHRFRKLFGISPRGLLVRLQVDRAKELLLTTDLSVKEIAFELGYGWQQDFTRAFKKCAGLSPSQWKQCAGDPLSPGRSGAVLSKTAMPISETARRPDLLSA